MNVIASKQALNDGATNMRVVFADVINDLADHIINTETGKRHYINGVRINTADVKPMLNMNLGYCNINMRIYRANLIILLPSSLDSRIVMNVIKSLINEVSIELTRRDVELGADTYVTDNMTFALSECEFLPAASSFHTNQESIQMTKRIFEYGQYSKNKARKSAFIWKIDTDFRMVCESPADIWLSDHADIHIDLANLRCANLGYINLNNITDILAHYGASISIVYKYNRSKDMSEPYLLPGTERKYINEVYEGDHPEAHVIKFKCLRADEYRKKDIQMIVIEQPESATTLTTCQFMTEFVKDHHDVREILHMCQMCSRHPAKYFYSIEKIESLKKMHAILCERCIRSDSMFVELSDQYNIYKVTHNVPFSRVSRDYGIKSSHIELFECNNFRENGYARDDNTFAFLIVKMADVGLIESLTQYLDDVRARGVDVDIITHRL